MNAKFKIKAQGLPQTPCGSFPYVTGHKKPGSCLAKLIICNLKTGLFFLKKDKRYFHVLPVAGIPEMGLTVSGAHSSVGEKMHKKEGESHLLMEGRRGSTLFTSPRKWAMALPMSP